MRFFHVSIWTGIYTVMCPDEEKSHKMTQNGINEGIPSHVHTSGGVLQFHAERKRFMQL